MKKIALLVASLLLVSNVVSAAVTKNSSKSEILAENQKLKAELEALKAQYSTSKTETETVKAENETVKAELAETQKKVPVVEPGHENDWSQVNFNLISGNNMRGFGHTKDDTYGEIEIMGREGILDMNGYIDFSDVMHSESSDLNNDEKEEANFFTEIQPRISLNGLFDKDLSIGPVTEWYLAGYIEAGDAGLWTNGIGIGSDVMVPWLGKVGLNAYALYSEEDFGSSRENDWNGYLVKTNWFKPLYFFEGGSFLAYQGYMNYMWDAGYEQEDNWSGTNRSNDEYQWFNGISWIFQDFALQYGLKYAKDMCNVDNSGDNDSEGFEHYFIVTYKF